ncbi:MAG: protein BatD [Rhodothermales bacterium]|nr:protein BatD [Rhodothermales bacterium]
MGRYLATITVVCLALGISSRSHAQSVAVSASVSENTIGTEERLTYTIEVQGTSLPSITAPEPPQVTGLTLNSSFPSTSRNISIINGQMTQSIGYSWVYSPVREGRASIAATNVIVADETFTTEPIQISVVPQSQRPVRQRRPNPLTDPFGLLDQDPADAPKPEISDRDIYIDARPNKRTVYQNEAVTIEYGLYFRSGIQLRQSRLADSWDAEGFWREDLDVEARPVPQTIVRNGIRYNMIVLKRVVVFPTRTGELQVDPLKIESEASVPVSSRETFFSLRNRYVPVELSSPAVKLNVRPLPDGAPDSFTGAVGDFELDAFVDKTELEVGESLSLKATVTGSGNIATMEGPVIDTPGVFERYDPQVDSRLNRSGSNVRGSKVFDFILVPRSNGKFEISPVEFTFFDTGSRSYRTLSSDPFSITVSGNNVSLESIAIATGSGFPIDDIAPPLVDSDDWRTVRDGLLHRSILPYIFLIFPLLILTGTYFYQAHMDKISGDLGYARNRRANPLARKHLKEANEMLARGDGSGYYAALERAVLGFVGDRLNLGEKALTRPELGAALKERRVEQETVDSLNRLLAECDMAQFSPVSPERRVMNDALDRATALIDALEGAFVSYEQAQDEAEVVE